MPGFGNIARHEYCVQCVFFSSFQVTLGKRTVLRRLSQDGGGEGRILSCEVHLPTNPTASAAAAAMRLADTTTNTSRGVSPDGSGRSTPISPPHNQLHYHHGAMVFSPPPSPMRTTPLNDSGGGGGDTSRVFLDFSSRSSSNVGGGGSGQQNAHHQEVSLVLKPVPAPRSNRPSPADSMKTLVNESLPEIQVSTNEEALAAGTRFSAADLSRRMSPRPLGLQRLRESEEGTRSLLASSSLSLPPESVVNSAASRLTAFNADMRSKTDNLERLISEVERSSADSLSGGGLGGREVKKYIRRRYTDSRHPTTELPDVRGDGSGPEPLPSVQNPPLRDVSLSRDSNLSG